MGEEGGDAILHAVSSRYAPYFSSKVSFSKIADADVIFSRQMIVHHGREYGVIILV